MTSIGSYQMQPPLHEVRLWLRSYVLISASMFTYGADERDTKELSKVKT
jgi:hypothetical protein